MRSELRNLARRKKMLDKKRNNSVMNFLVINMTWKPLRITAPTAI